MAAPGAAHRVAATGALRRLSSAGALAGGRVNRNTIIVVALAVVLGVCLFWGVGKYNGLVASAQQVDSQWAQVENVYQRRADLVPNLVETVKGAAAHERETLEAVTAARARVGSAPSTPPTDPGQLAEYEAAQSELGTALGRLMVVVEAYPELKANENFRDLQSQLEGTENRIAVERMRFNETAREFNTKRESFPTSMIAGMFGSKFATRPYFHSQAGAEMAPKVSFPG